MINTMSIKTDFTFYISIYFLCPFKSIFLYGIFLILIVVYCLTICIRFEGKIYISYNLISYGPNGPLEFAHFLQQMLLIILSTEMREHMVSSLMFSTGMISHMVLPLMSSTGMRTQVKNVKNVHACLVETDHIHLLILSSQHYHQSTFVFGYQRML